MGEEGMVIKVCGHASGAVGGGWGGGKTGSFGIHQFKVQITKQVTLSVVVFRCFIL
jgi:hypothetical protein